jgi:hypothetical protein
VLTVVLLATVEMQVLVVMVGLLAPVALVVVKAQQLLLVLVVCCTLAALSVTTLLQVLYLTHGQREVWQLLVVMVVRLAYEALRVLVVLAEHWQVALVVPPEE